MIDKNIKTQADKTEHVQKRAKDGGVDIQLVDIKVKLNQRKVSNRRQKVRKTVPERHQTISNSLQTTWLI